MQIDSIAARRCQFGCILKRKKSSSYVNAHRNDDILFVEGIPWESQNSMEESISEFFDRKDRCQWCHQSHAPTTLLNIVPDHT